MNRRFPLGWLRMGFELGFFICCLIIAKFKGYSFGDRIGDKMEENLWYASRDGLDHSASIGEVPTTEASKH